MTTMIKGQDLRDVGDDVMTLLVIITVSSKYKDTKFDKKTSIY